MFAPDDPALLIPRLPLPLAELLRRCRNAKTPLERHLTAYYLWECALKLLGSAAVADYAELPDHDPALADLLANLARPAVGHWWQFARRLVPVLADRNVAGYPAVRDLLLGRARDNCPRAAGLDAALTELLDGKRAGRATVRLTELFDHLICYRNHLVGHGAPGQLRDDFNDRMADALVAGVSEVLARLDVLAGRRLVFVESVRPARGAWLVRRVELTGEAPARLESVEVPRDPVAAVPDEGAVYLWDGSAPPPGLRPLHPLVLFDPDAAEVLFLNARRGRARAEYLCYTTGRVADRDDLGADARALLARALGVPVTPADEQAWAAASHAGEPPAGEPAAGAARRLLGEFELLSELGRGGMGVVYRAWQPSLRRQVALKKLLQAADVGRAEERFRREIRALGKVDHPHLVKVYTSGADGDDWYYAMELVEGAPLSAVCEALAARSSAAAVDLPTWRASVSTACEQARKEEKPLSDSPAPTPARPPEESIDPPGHFPSGTRAYVQQVGELLATVAEAAHALHEAGVVHRDIKPGNVIVSPDGTRAVLMDLGLAQVADEVDGKLTRTRQFVGTLRYASPEQVLAVGGVDRRADVYGIGATLWELLTLRPLFGATDQTPTPQLMLDIQNREPERLRACNPAVGRDLEAVVHKCLEKRPERRYQSARELAEDLRRWLAGEPVEARPVSSIDRGLKWVRRHPSQALALALALAVVLLGAVAGVVGWFWSEAEAARTAADQSRAEAVVERGRAESARDRLGEANTNLATTNTRLDEALRDLGKANEKIEFLNYARLVELAYRDYYADEVAEARRKLALCPERFRHWEWHFVHRLCYRDRVTLGGHATEVRSAAMSADGTRVVTAQDRGPVQVWDRETGGLRVTLSIPDRADTYSAEFSPNGERVLTVTLGVPVRIWNSRTGEQVASVAAGSSVESATFSPNGEHILVIGGGKARVADAATGREVAAFLSGGGKFGSGSAAICPGGKRAVVAGPDGRVRLVDIATGKELRVYTTGAGYVALSPNGRWVVTYSNTSGVEFWDAESGKRTSAVEGSPLLQEPIAAFTADGSRYATTVGDDIRIWDVATGKMVATLREAGTGGLWRDYSRDGKWVATFLETGGLRAVRLWDAVTAQPVTFLRGHAGPLSRCLFSSDGKWVITTGGDKTVRIWATEDREVLELREGALGAHVHHTAFSPDGNRLVAANDDKVARIWDAQTGRLLVKLTGHTAGVTRVAFSPDGTQVATLSADQTIRTWDAGTGAPVAVMKGHKPESAAHPVGVRYHGDGSRVVSMGQDGLVRVWDSRSGSQLQAFPISGGVCVSASSPNGVHLAIGGTGGNARIWNVDTGAPVARLTGHTSQITSIEFSPSGACVVTASHDGTAAVWDANSGARKAVLAGHTGWVMTAVFDQNGTRVLTTSADQSARIWDAATGRQLVEMIGHTAGVLHGAFTPDGQRVLTSSGDGTMRVWDAASGLLLLTLRGGPEDYDLAVSPDGTRVAHYGRGGVIRIYDSNPVNRAFLRFPMAPPPRAVLGK